MKFQTPATSDWHDSTVVVAHTKDETVTKPIFTQHELDTIEVSGNSVEDVEYLARLWKDTIHAKPGWTEDMWSAGYAEGRFDEYVSQNAIVPYCVDLAKEKGKKTWPDH